MGKKKSHKHTQQHKYELTKHQLSRQEQQKKRQKMFRIIGICVIAVVAGVLGGSWYKNEYVPMHEKVIRVNDVELDMAHYVNVLNLRSQSYVEYYGKEQASQYMPSLADSVEVFVEQSELMRQAAEDFGIVVSDEEINTALKESDPPLGKEYRNLMQHDLMVQRLLDEHFDSQVPVSGLQSYILAMMLESQSQADGIRTRVARGEDFYTLAEEYSLDDFSPQGDGDLGWYPEGLLGDILGLTVIDDFAFSADAGDLSQPLYDENWTKAVGYWLAQLVETDEDETGTLYHLKVMLLGSEAEAEDIRTRVENGEDFGDLAEEYSQDDASKDDGGDMDWLALEDIYEPLRDYVLNFEPGSVSDIVKDTNVTTTGGYWLVKITETDDNREIQEEYRTVLKAQVMDDWLQALLEDPQTVIESYLDTDKKDWAIAKALNL